MASVGPCSVQGCDGLGANLMNKFGERLRNLRKGRQWSQERLGFELAVGKATVSKWENGITEPGLGQLLAIKHLFGDEVVSLDYLLGDDAAVRCADADATGDIGIVSEEELQLLVCYRRLSLKQRRSLLGLLGT